MNVAGPAETRRVGTTMVVGARRRELALHPFASGQTATGVLAEGADWKGLAGQQRGEKGVGGRQPAQQLEVTNLTMCANLFKAMALPVASYASEVWGVSFLDPLAAVSTPLQPVFSSFLRRCMRLPDSTAHWVTLLEAGQLPLQYFWMRRTVTFYNSVSCLSFSSPILTACMAAQRAHAASGDAHSCWLATVRRHFLKAIELALPASPPKLVSRLHVAAAQLECGAVVSDSVLWSAYQTAYHTLLASYVPPACAGPEHPACPHRTICAYLSWFWGGKFRKQPAYLADEGLSGKVVAAMLRFRTLNCDLPVHTLLDVPFAARSCDCGCGAAHLAGLSTAAHRLSVASHLQILGNERHLALHCTYFDAFRDDYAAKLEFGTDFRTFMRQPSGVLASYIYRLLRRRRAYLYDGP